MQIITALATLISFVTQIVGWLTAGARRAHSHVQWHRDVHRQAIEAQAAIEYWEGVQGSGTASHVEMDRLRSAAWEKAKAVVRLAARKAEAI